MITTRFMIPATLCILVVNGPARAEGHQEDQDHHEKKHHYGEQHHATRGTGAGGSQEAHVHGIAKLLVVLEGKQLDIELHSPAMNLLGFEHQARSPEDHTSVQNAKETLADADRLFRLDSARCRLGNYEVDFSGVDEKDHDTDHHQARGHSDITAHYRYHCDRPDKLGSLATKIPAEFPGVASLQVQWIVNSRQGAATLDNTQHHIMFR